MITLRLGCITLIAVGLSFALSSVRTATRMLEKQFSELSSQIKAERDKTALASTELAYLSHPKRIRILAERFLKLKQADRKQIIFSRQTPLTCKLTKDEIVPMKQVRWRYKNSAKKYVETASKE